ncbi:hypothetical protein C0993_003584 [Termitomyces sp. T159_Od127]|nr:hypothetical protein C0993_003584 [Termitomyces sp. T159_Od127]
MPASPVRPNRLAAWNKTTSKPYVPLSDSDDDACERQPHLGLNDSFMYDSDDSFNAPPRSSSSNSKQTRKTYASSSSFSDSSNPTSNLRRKSPRKSKEQTSPRKSDVVAKAKSRRPCSPSPMKAAKKADRLGVEESVIDLSDSDDELPPPPIFQEPPLMRARARAHAKTGGKQTLLDDFTRRFEKQIPEQKTRNLGCDDVIDLT